MNTFLTPYIANVRPTRYELDRLLDNVIFGIVHPFIYKWLKHFPQTVEQYRAELRPGPRAAGGYEVANLHELILFARRNTQFLQREGPIEGYDKVLIKGGKKDETSFVIPVASFVDGKINVDLNPDDIPDTKNFILYRIKQTNLYFNS